MPLSGRHQLSRQRRGWRWVAAAGGAVGCLAGLQEVRCKLTAAAIHGRQRCQADGVPDTGVHADRVAHEPQLWPRGLLAAKLSCQGGPHSSSQRAVPKVVAAAGVGDRAAAGAGLRAAAAHARSLSGGRCRPHKPRHTCCPCLFPACLTSLFACFPCRRCMLFHKNLIKRSNDGATRCGAAAVASPQLLTLAAAIRFLALAAAGAGVAASAAACAAGARHVPPPRIGG